MNIAFFVRHFTERGTEVAVYDYAKYNKHVLNNNSIIICFTETKQRSLGFPTERPSYDKFKSKFSILEINDMQEMSDIIKKYNLHFFHTLTHGGNNDIYQFENKLIWGNCKTIKHAVFDTSHPESDFYISISDMLNSKFNTNIPVIPHIVDLPICFEDLRDDLHIPKDAVVFGRYGGYDEFNINIAREAIIEFLRVNNNSYFLFMNTNKFYQHPRIIYVDKNINLVYKVKFINTCDAMIHAREMGETFGLSIAEFSIKNKPIITCSCGDLEHIKILGDKALIYTSKESLIHIFANIKDIINSQYDWNAYKLYSPEYIMSLFKNIFNDYKLNICDKICDKIYDKKIIDCFIFYNEFDLLTYRLNLLNDVVDYFVLVESRHTFVGKEKSLFYNENKQLFERFNHKIIHVIIDDFPHKYPNINIETGEQWTNERFQRNCISRGIDKLKLQPTDIITITDVDEIPNPSILENIKTNTIPISVNILEMDFYYYNLNTRMNNKWHHAKIFTFQKYMELNMTCDNIRMTDYPIIVGAGWHLSYFGNEKFIKNKLENFSHQEYNKAEFTNEKQIEERIKNKSDLFGRNGIGMTNIPIRENNNLPCLYEKYLTNFIAE
jgi:beta-1,4-mannosyl-glycoprotein beta-1,4-N-acetylglucosaminyltransferase